MYIQTFQPTETGDALQGGPRRRAPAPPLEEPLHSLVERIEPEPVRGAMRRIFSDLSRMLEYTRWVERALREDAAGAFRACPPVHLEARALLDFIAANAAALREHSEALYHALDGTSYAISHELRRVFEHDLVGLSTREDGPQALAQVAHAHGLLRNCFQQTVITLAQVFDPALDGPAIFDDCQTRLEESLVLWRDLFRLVRLMRRAEEERSRPAIIALVVNLQNFRRGSMRYLMYRDWAEYERLVREVLSTTNVEELVPVLGRFACYLETLLGHVRMRSVLINHPRVLAEVEADDEFQEEPVTV